MASETSGASGHDQKARLPGNAPTVFSSRERSDEVLLLASHTHWPSWRAKREARIRARRPAIMSSFQPQPRVDARHKAGQDDERRLYCAGRPMAHLARRLNQLIFTIDEGFTSMTVASRGHEGSCHSFDASLLSNSKPPETAALFWKCPPVRTRWNLLVCCGISSACAQ